MKLYLPTIIFILLSLMTLSQYIGITDLTYAISLDEEDEDNEDFEEYLQKAQKAIDNEDFVTAERYIELMSNFGINPKKVEKVKNYLKSKKHEYDKKIASQTTKPKQTQSSTKESSVSSCQDYAYINFNAGGDFENYPNVKLSGPPGITIDSSSNSNGVSIQALFGNKCVKGQYSFVYSHEKYKLGASDGRAIYSGTIYIDGKYKNYNVLIHTLTNDISISGY